MQFGVFFLVQGDLELSAGSRTDNSSRFLSVSRSEDPQSPPRSGRLPRPPATSLPGPTASLALAEATRLQAILGDAQPTVGADGRAAAERCRAEGWAMRAVRGLEEWFAGCVLNFVGFFSFF